MSEPFKYTGAKVQIDGVDLDATDVEITSGSAIFDNSPSGMQRALSRQLAPATQTINVTIRSDSRGLYRDLKAMHAKIHNLDKPLSIPSAQEILMRQELGEFDA